MDAPADNAWQQHSVRQTPLLLWGAGETGRAVAGRFLAALGTCADATGQVPLCQALQDPLAEWREQFKSLREAAQAQGKTADFEVAVLTAVREFAARQHSELISRLDQLLVTTLPGKTALTLVVLLPSLNTDDADKQQTRRCFLELDRLSAKLSSLNLILLCRTPAQPVDKEAPDLLATLFHSLVDAELAGLLRRHSQHLSRRTVNGHPAVYCALGVQNLRCQQAALLEQVQARFQNALFWCGLANPNQLSPAQRSALQAQARECLRDCTSAFAEQYHTFPEAVAYLPGNPPGTAEAEQVHAVFEAEFNTAEQQIKTRLEPFLATLEQRLREEFAAVLAAGPACLAGGRFYLEALATALQESQEEFCRKPLQAAVTAYYEARLEKLISSFRLPVARAGQESIATVRAAVQALHTAIAGSTVGQHIPARFLALSWDHVNGYLDRRSPSVTDARRLLSATCSLFLTAARPLAEPLQDVQRRQDALRMAGAESVRKRPWHRRLLQRPATGQESRTGQARLAALEQERVQWQGPYATMHRFYLSLISEILWPQIMRLLIVEGFRRRLQALMLEFTAFWAGVGAACAERWRDAEYLPVFTTGSTNSVVTRAQLDTLYENTAGSPVWLDCAVQALRFLPGTARPTPSYQHCQNLHDHFQAGPDSLLERLADFTAERFAPLRAHNVLDLLELSGTGQARELLNRMLAQAQSWPVFAPALWARLKQQDLPRRIKVIRCTPLIREALQSRYGDLLSADDCFLDSVDPQVIELTVLTIGFPASLLDDL